MRITEVKITLTSGYPHRNDRLRAFVSIVFDDCFAVRDIRVIQGKDGGPFVAMPSRKRSEACPECSEANHSRARYCNECGQHLGEMRASALERSAAELHSDVAFPINAAFRRQIDSAVLGAYREASEGESVSFAAGRSVPA